MPSEREKVKCPICNNDAERLSNFSFIYSRIYSYYCDKCKMFKISQKAAKTFPEIIKKDYRDKREIISSGLKGSTKTITAENMEPILGEIMGDYQNAI